MKRILVPTDFSDGAWNALEYAIGLAKHFSAEIVIINAFEEPQAGASSLVSIRHILQQDSEAGIEEWSDKLKATNLAQGLEVKMKSYYGSVTGGLSTFIGEYKEQMVVMGSLGKSGQLEKLLGSNASDVIRDAKCPVLVVPINAKLKLPRKVVFAADIHQIPANTNLKLLKALCLWDPADNLDVLHVAGAEEDPSLDLEVFESFLNDIPHKTQVIQGKEIAETIDHYMDDHEADLLVMIKQRKGFIERLLKGSVTKRVSLYAHTPILVLKAL